MAKLSLSLAALCIAALLLGGELANKHEGNACECLRAPSWRPALCAERPLRRPPPFAPGRPAAQHTLPHLSSIRPLCHRILAEAQAGRPTWAGQGAGQAKGKGKTKTCPTDCECGR